MNVLAEPFAYDFFLRGMAAAALAGALCAAVGVYVVLRGLSYIGHGLAHGIFGGAVVSFVAGVSFYAGATVWGALSVLLINGAARRRQIGGDAAVGIVTTSAFALGVALISRQGRFSRDFDAALFGEILGISDADLFVIAGVLALTAAVLFVWWKAILFTVFDAEVAGTSGVPVGWVEALFSLVLAATVIASLRVLGVTLIAAALVIPPVTARLLADSFGRLFALSALLGGLGGLGGVYLSWHADVSSGAAIVLLQAALFLLALGWTAARSRWAGASGREGAERLAALGRPPLE